MKIGIYGDSYVSGLERNNQTWAHYLARLMGATDVSYHGLSGSSFYWTYQQILSTADQYDQIIVAVTEAMRFPVRVDGCFVTGVSCLDQLTDISDRTRQYLQGWFMISDLDYLYDMQNLMIRDIAHRFPNARFLACFHDSIKDQEFYLAHVNLLVKQQLDLTALDDAGDFLEETSGLLCHIPLEWHMPLAEYLYKFIDCPRIPPLDPGIFPPLGSREQYFNIRR